MDLRQYLLSQYLHPTSPRRVIDQLRKKYPEYGPWKFVDQNHWTGNDVRAAFVSVEEGGVAPVMFFYFDSGLTVYVNDVFPRRTRR